MSEAIARAGAEATRVAIQTMAEAQTERMHNESGPKVGSPAMKELTFDWNTQDKYSELKTFRLEVNNNLSTYKTPQTDKLALVKNWFGRKELQYLVTLLTAEKETCITLDDLFETLSNKCNYQEVDRQLKEQFIHSLNNKHMLEEIIKELTATKNDHHITSGGVLAWAKRVEVQRAQTAVLNMLTESRQFDKVKISKKKKKKKDITRAPGSWTMQWQPCTFCGGIH